MTIFEITGSDIEKLSDTDLRLLIGKLSEQELVVHGHSPVAVTYGGNQNAMDGGIDVRINSRKFLNSGFVPRPQTGFQVKAEDLPPSEIEKEMRPNTKLRFSIIDLGENDGAYIIVSSKGSVADTAYAARKNKMAAAIADTPSAATLYLDFYDRQRGGS